MIKKFWYNITCIPYRIKWKVLDIWKAIKFGFQRMFKGYDDSDGWAFKWNFVDKNYKILNHFFKTHKSYPYNMTESGCYYPERGEFAWQKELMNIIEGS